MNRILLLLLIELQLYWEKGKNWEIDRQELLDPKYGHQN